MHIKLAKVLKTVLIHNFALSIVNNKYLKHNLRFQLETTLALGENISSGLK
jgi:hypothetical protein